MKNCICLLLLCLAVPCCLFAQKKNESFKYYIHRATSPIKIDGIANEKAWKDAQSASDFYMVLPMDTSCANVSTDVRMAYDNQNLYLLAICYKEISGPNMVESLRRDFNFQKNDNFLVFMDTFGDETTGFSFGANAAGAQWDGTMYDGGKVDLNWDNKWVSAVKNDGYKYVLELAIPFKTIRYKKGIKEWGINFSRNDLKTTEKSSWTPIPRQFPTASLSYTGSLVWDAPLPEAGHNISIIPYLLTGLTKDYVAHSPAAFKNNVGADAKITLSSSMNLDLTVHPDFSQVDVDKQVTNLSRFELFFPEKRQFFLENADLFSNLGYANIRPFFSRRIGLNAPIGVGARLSGKIDKNWRVGVMDMETDKTTDVYQPAENFAVVALQRKLFKKSNIELFYIDKTAINYHPSKDTVNNTFSSYNRNIGLEYNLAPSNNIWTGKTIFIQSFSPGNKGNGFVNAANLLYSVRKWQVGWEHEYVGNNYNAEVGYVPRNNYIKINPTLNRFFFPKGGPVLSHGPQLSSTYYFDTKFHRTDNENSIAYLITFRNRSTFNAVFLNDYVQLLSPFDPTNLGKDSLPKGFRSQWNTVGFDIVSAPQHTFTYSFSTRIGGYYDHGKLWSFSGDVGYRIQPIVNIDLAATYNDLKLGQPWGDTHFLLVGPKVDVTMTNTLFLTAYMQYNQQTKNINFNTRFQWRYKPASDLFVVYTDNYYIGPVFVKSRQLVLKFTYWWNP
ncbi:MAG TPA: DUF5916 domain-containing protein [Chitinophagaceae bacterium]|nr:DUF5916 domain-containing protein [Chitinophagaceae bacterium]